MGDTNSEVAKRFNVKRQTLDDGNPAPAYFLKIDVINPVTLFNGFGKERYTDYEVRMRTNLPVFKQKESTVRRRYSDFEWLRNELERDSKIVVSALPSIPAVSSRLSMTSKAWKEQLPFRKDAGIYDEKFIEERRKGLKVFLNKIAGRAQNERCLHKFLQDDNIDKNYVPGKIRNTRERHSSFKLDSCNLVNK